MADRQVARLKAALAEREARVQILEARVSALEESTSLRVGRAVTDAALVLDTADVDLVIVDAAAGAPGGPWAYLGVPGVPDRERALLGLMEVARGRNRPVVLLGTSPGLAGLGWDATVKDGTPPDEALTGLCARLGIDQP